MFYFQSHERTHTKEKPHKCDICGTCFSLSRELKIHQRKHTGDRPFKCPINQCPSTFPDPSNLRKHKKRHLAWLEIVNQESEQKDGGQQPMGDGDENSCPSGAFIVHVTSLDLMIDLAFAKT